MYRFYAYTVRDVPQMFRNRSMAENFCTQNGIDIANIFQLFEFKVPEYKEPVEPTSETDPTWTEP